MSIAALIPAYNPGEVLVDTVNKTLVEVDHIILVDDGCDELNVNILNQLDQSSDDITLLVHDRNFGKGYAIQSGLTHALEQGHDYVIMLDSDGQHDPAEIRRFKDKISATAAPFIIGTRTQIDKMPLKSKVGNVLMTWAFKLMTGKKLVDTQSGFRALSKSFISRFLNNCSPGRYETEMKMLLLAAKESRHIEQVAIKTIYIDENSNSKFNPILDSIRVLSSFLLFVGIGLLSFLLNYSAFWMLTVLGDIHFLNAHLISRLLGAAFNFFNNKQYIYNPKDATASGTKVSAISKHVLEVFNILLISSVLLYFFVTLFDWNSTWSKPVAD